MKRLIVDLDYTLCIAVDRDYANARPKEEVIERLREYRNEGFQIVVNTSRNVNTFNGNTGQINVHTLPIVIEWLRRHQVPFDEVHVGKPWCGEEGFYVDDRAVRPSEFVRYSRGEIDRLLERER